MSLKSKINELIKWHVPLHRATSSAFSLAFFLSFNYYSQGASVYDSGKPFFQKSEIDRLQALNLTEKGIKPAEICSDAVFLRRIYLDIIGTIPTLEETEKFLSDNSPDKRAKLVDSLLSRSEFAKYWALKWCEILRVKSEFPVNLWPNAVFAYSHWIWNAVQTNMPYDKFASALLTTSGSNFRDPPANFFRSTQDKTPTGFAKIAILTFLGSRFEKWDSNSRKEMEKLFSRIVFKKTDEWKEEILFLSPEASEEITVKMPDGTTLNVSADEDPRKAFASWLTGPAKKWFADAAVNRIWFWLFGRGIINEADDFVFTKKDDGILKSVSNIFTGDYVYSNRGNPPCNPELLDYLSGEFIRLNYDTKALIRLIVNSAAYQQSCVPALSTKFSDAEKYFAIYPTHPIEAEVLADIFSRISQQYPKYVSVIPEPFTYVPETNLSIELYDGSITSAFLETFGRPSHDTGLLSERTGQITYTQRLFLLNSPFVIKSLTDAPIINKILKESKDKKENAAELINQIYLLLLSRYPSDNELEKIFANFAENIKNRDAAAKKTDAPKGKLKNAKFAIRQLVWALLNTKEFLFKH